MPGGSDLRPLESFTFLAPSPSTLTAAQIFDGEQEKNLLFLIERARAGGRGGRCLLFLNDAMF